MGISVFPEPSSETTPIGAGTKVIDGWTGVGSYTTSSLPAGEYVAYSSAPNASSQNFKFNSYILMNGNNAFVSVGNDSGGAHFKNSSSGTMFFSNPYGTAIGTRNSAFQGSHIYKFGSTYYAVSQNNSNAATVTWFFTSTDLITWTQVNATGTPVGGYFWAMAYSPGLNRIVAITRDNGNNGMIYTSDNGGANWTSRTTLTNNGQLYDIEFSGSIFLAQSNATNLPFHSSPDGITWTQRANPLTTAQFHSIEWGNNIFVCSPNAHTSGNYITSPDGINLTARTNPFGTNIGLNRARYLNGKWVLTCPTRNNSCTSTDGITWTVGNSWAGGSGTTIRGYINGHYLMYVNYSSGTYSQNGMYGSIDGLNWTLLYSIYPAQDPNANNYNINSNNLEQYPTLGTELYLINNFADIVKRIPGYFALYNTKTTADLN
jgi:hypothetical protein